MARKSKLPKKKPKATANIKLLPTRKLPDDKEELRLAVAEIIEGMSDREIDGFVVYAWSKEESFVDTGYCKTGSMNPYLVPTIVAEAIRKWGI